MRFDYSQSMKLGQQLKLGARMIQSMEILQMSLAELEERVEQELESNPTLETVEIEPDANAPAPEAATSPDLPLNVGESDSQEFERLDQYESDNPDVAANEFSESPPREYEDSYQRSREAGSEAGDAKIEAMAAVPARSLPLIDQLQDQWELCDADESFKPLGAHIISFIDENGFLHESMQTIAERAQEMTLPALTRDDRPTRGKPTLAHLEHTLRAVQLFLDPPGLAARDYRECLLLQLDALEGDDTPGRDDIPIELIEQAKKVVSEHLSDLTSNRLPRIAERTGLQIEDIKRTLMLLKKLSLAPGKRLVSDNVTPIVPDAIVEYDADQDRYICYLNDSRIPNLRINREYALLTKDKAMVKKDRDFIKTNIGNAMWLIDALNQRKQTLLKVLERVVEYQRDYFDHGPQALKPLPMLQVAQDVGIHVATVSRAVAEKYIQTPRGSVALRKLFSGGIPTTAAEDGGGGGETLAWDAIKEALRDIIEHEDKAAPLSDEDLVLELKKRGIDIARRTVAKYRDQIGFPTARMRKTF